MPSRPARDAWIETVRCRKCDRVAASRVPHGTRGLKPRSPQPARVPEVSRPARDAWIETVRQTVHRRPVSSRPARDAWIETIQLFGRCSFGSCRVPHGTRGLKRSPSAEWLTRVSCRVPHGTRGLKQSLPLVRGAKLNRRVPHGTRGLKLEN